MLAWGNENFRAPGENRTRDLPNCLNCNVQLRTLGARGFFLVGGDRTLSGEAAKESREAARKTRSEASRR